MKYFYISDGQNTIGPLSKLKLFSKNITKDTLVWYEGLSEWKKAGDMEELADLFSNRQTPPPNTKPYNPNRLLLRQDSNKCLGILLNTLAFSRTMPS